MRHQRGAALRSSAAAAIHYSLLLKFIEIQFLPIPLLSCPSLLANQRDEIAFMRGEPSVCLRGLRRSLLEGVNK